MVKPLFKHFGNYSFLLIVLVLMMLLEPTLGARGEEFVTLAFTFLFLAGLYAVRGSRRTLVGGLALVVPALLAGWAAYAVDSRVLFAIGRGLEALFLLYVTASILHHVMTESEITNDTIYGAAAAYLMIGIAFAVVYGWLEVVAPGSLRGLTPESGTWAGSYHFGDFVYFSLVTQTTLGYGDMTPVSQEARSLATLQAVAGQFYVAVLVARIVAILSTKTHTPKV
jgi:uncharacterized membrane protein